MDMYLHDSAATFRFVLRGELTGDHVAGLRHAWATAQSILGTKELVVDLSGITTADAAGFEMLCEMRRSGAHLIGGASPASAEFLSSLGVPVVAPVCRRANAMVRLAHILKRTAGFHVFREER
jgi:ABC-type transporter Mla MlaB component